jgi:hypothetical protein
MSAAAWPRRPGLAFAVGVRADVDGSAEAPASTADRAADGEGVPGGDGRRGGSPSWWRRYRVLTLAALGALLVTLFLGIAHSRSVHGALDPRAADEQGSRALAVLLGERGVAVHRVTQLDDALDGATDRSIVLIPFPHLLRPADLRRAGDLESGQLVLVGPDSTALAAATEQITTAGTVATTTRSPDCPVDAATAAGPAQTGGRTYRVAEGESCYPADGDPTLAVAQTHGGARLVVLGAGGFLTNGQLSQEGNAALALNLLGADGSADEVRWLVPVPGSAAAPEQSASLSDIVPSWVGPAALQLLVAGVVAALWRARRLGPPVTEPLPVVVRSAEAVEGRARLYRRGQARDRAAEALRAGTRARLVPRLGVGREAGGEPAPATVVDVISDWTRRPESEVHEALYGPPPPDDAALVRLADALDSIVRETLDPEVRRP